MEFFDIYERAIKSWNFIAGRVYNIDETGVFRDVQPRNIVAQIGKKQVGQSVSGEKGIMITVRMMISSACNTVPGVFIFPIAIFYDSRMIVAPPGSLGLVNSPQSS